MNAAKAPDAVPLAREIIQLLKKAEGIAGKGSMEVRPELGECALAVARRLSRMTSVPYQ